MLNLRQAMRICWSVCFALSIAIAAPMTTAHAAVTPPPAPCTPAQQMGLVFIIDDSGSMSWNDPNHMAGESVAAAVDTVRPGTVVAVSKFSTNASELVSPALVSDTNSASIASTVKTGLIQMGATYFDRAFTEAKRQLDAMPSTVDSKAVIFMSDGTPTDPAFTKDQLLGVPIHTFSFGAQANDTVLQGIATRSSGTFTKVAAPADLMTSFTQLVSTMACDTTLATKTTTIAPGVTIMLPFTSGIDVGEFLGSAIWDEGQIVTKIHRPNGSIMSEASLIEGEKITPQTFYTTFDVVKPMVGLWVAEFKNASSRSSNVSIRITKRITPIAINCSTFTAVKSGRSIDLNWTRSVDPRVAYVIDYSIGADHRRITGISNPSYQVTENVDYGLGFSVTLMSYIRNRRVGLPCIRSFSMGPVPLVQGTDSADNITGIAFRDYVLGMGGDDTISTLELPDKVLGGAGNDSIDGGDGNDTLRGEAGDDTLIGGAGGDALDGGPSDLGSDTLLGGDGNDRLTGGPGNDDLTGGTGRDIMDGGPGNDVIHADDGQVARDVISCGLGIDTVYADKNKDIVTPGCENITWL